MLLAEPQISEELGVHALEAHVGVLLSLLDPVGVSLDGSVAAGVVLSLSWYGKGGEGW